MNNVVVFYILKIFYVVIRIIRRNMPIFLYKWLMHKNIVMIDNIGHNQPYKLIKYYSNVIDEKKYSLQNKTIFECGAGEYPGSGIAYIEKGAELVIHNDPGIIKNKEKIKKYLFKEFNSYFDRIELKQNELIYNNKGKIVYSCDYLQNIELAEKTVDLIISYSVMEHLKNIETCFNEMYRILKSGGAMIHFIDLRDHFFFLPFHFLLFSEKIWNNFLTPKEGFYLNRLRKCDYENILKNYEWSEIEIKVLENDINAVKNVYKKVDIMYKDIEINKLSSTVLRIYCVKK